MRLDIPAFAIACGLVWGATGFCVAVANFGSPGYGGELIWVLASVYPGYTGTPNLAQAAIGALYALFSAVVLSAVFGGVYNLLVALRSRPS